MKVTSLAINPSSAILTIVKKSRCFGDNPAILEFYLVTEQIMLMIDTFVDGVTEIMWRETVFLSSIICWHY
ncbi:hypothetical protein CRG92_22515 [Escherichia sp. E2586]|nr:hypothetical protein CRG92_22515 [Escherichia sp. E2586]